MLQTHPVYGLPNGWAFAIWGIIFLTLGLYTVYQVLPSRYHGGLECAHVARIRVYVIAFELFNSAWNFLFGWEEYWMALLDIVIYDILLWVVIAKLDVNYFVKIDGMSRGQSIRTKLFVAMPFSIHAGWVTVASVLNIQVNALEEGWLPSPGFSIGCCWLAVAIGIYRTVVPNADLPYTLATIWALGGIISNQSPDSSTFGCISRICDACNRAQLPICARVNSAAADRLPNGWAALDCASTQFGTNISGWGTAATVARNNVGCVEQIVPKSPVVVWWSVAGMACVSAAFAVGVARAYCVSCMAAASPEFTAAKTNKGVEKAHMMEDGQAAPLAGDARPGATPSTISSM